MGHGYWNCNWPSEKTSSTQSLRDSGVLEEPEPDPGPVVPVRSEVRITYLHCGENVKEKTGTPLKIHIAPEKLWLEDYFPFGKVTFQGIS